MLKLIKNPSGYQLQGSLVYDSINDLLVKGADAIKFKAETVQIDCEQLSRIDSAGVALFISWQRYCEQNNQQLQLTNLPQQAVSLIKANKLEGFFLTSS
ncbi:MAG: STAS domain-containing protein [Cocleimonas sp.]|nr:STAS domain-containing protein [Cocleimonas sp.]